MSRRSGARLPRLDQLLASLGYGSRREVGTAISDGRVCGVDGSILVDCSARVDPGEVLFDGEPLDHPAPLLLLMNKAAGSVCSWDPQEGRSIYDALPERWRRRNPRINCVGRLDRDTTGAILLTDDGDLLHRLASPKGGLEKVYLATLDNAPAPDAADLFASGNLHLEGEARACLPAELSILAPDIEGRPRAKVILREGKYHQVKRMFEAVGCRVIALHREAFGPYSADDIPPGAWRELEI